MPKVRITPPRSLDIPEAKWGAALPGQYNVLDTRWSPVAFQGQISVNPDPNPFETTKRTIPKDPTLKKDWQIGSEYDVSPQEAETLRSMGYEFEMV